MVAESWVVIEVPATHYCNTEFFVHKASFTLKVDDDFEAGFTNSSASDFMLAIFVLEFAENFICGQAQETSFWAFRSEDEVDYVAHTEMIPVSIPIIIHNNINCMKK